MEPTVKVFHVCKTYTLLCVDSDSQETLKEFKLVSNKQARDAQNIFVPLHSKRIAALVLFIKDVTTIHHRQEFGWPLSVVAAMKDHSDYFYVHALKYCRGYD
jgi:hypothetical protein